ncbi:hypothetical protein JCM33374_g4256 [Metschnikowia sp. JCM 33374]|nr:hypothetical protein JCM33374_g4256 [Metschnikowia sp. JCM 33374]
MGIAELWQILPSDERVPFPVFIARFLEKHKRPPRFAIDAYMFMFWSSLSNGDDIPDPEKERIDTRNFMAKLWYLVQNNVSFVVVFDGKFKPEKLRNGIIPEIPGSASYDEILKSFLSLHSSDYSEGSNVIENLKKILLRNRMDWVQAPAEGEAECARLQRLGVVDYVISDDSDTLVFGATGVLRWFNRVKYHKEDGEKVMSSTDYYVTPVHMSHVTELTNLTKNHLIMIAVLRGGDYSTGAENIGITRAKELALCGTTMLSNLPRKTLQDFGSFPDLTSMFINTFLESEKANVIMSDPYYGRKSELDRHESLASFNDFFNEFLIQEGKKVFGRATNFKKKTQIQDYYAMLYLFPLVNTKVFKFSPHSTTFGELEPVTADLTSVKIDCEVSRFNFVVSPRIIGKSIIKDEVQSFVQYVDLMIDKTPLPRERKYNLKAFLLKFLRDKKFWDLIQLARIKELDGVPMAVLKFNRVKLNEFVYYTRKDLDLDLEVVEDKASEVSEEKLPGVSEINEESEDSKLPEPKEDENKLISVVVPLECVSYVSREFVKVFKPQPSRKSPTKKKPPPQKTTLDKIWPGLSPTRGEKCIDQSNISQHH